jgi:Na+-transporting methylmalonyl-CoA/oxaloacetate decarboxylase gamma subunit
MDEGMVFVLIILFFFVLPIVIIGTYSSHRKAMAKLGNKLNDSERSNIENELAAVKKRLEVVEAIVTDKRYQLDAELAELSRSDRIQ